MFDQLFQMFSGSKQGQGALTQLMGQGYSQPQATGMLQAALPAAAQALQRYGTSSVFGAQQGGAQPGRPQQGGAQPGGAQAGHGLLDIGSSHYAQNFLTAAVSGLLRGEGVMGAAVDGAQGVVGGHVAEVLAARFGLPSRVAGVVGAVITPYMIDFLWEKMKGGSFDLGSLMGGGAQQAQTPWGGGSGLGYSGGQQNTGAAFGGPSTGGWIIPGSKPAQDPGAKSVAGAYGSGYTPGIPGLAGIFGK